MHLLHFGTYEELLFPYVKHNLRADKIIKNETDFVFHLLSSADEEGEAVRNATPAAASRYKTGVRAIPEDIAISFHRKGARDMVAEYLDYLVVPYIDQGRKQQLIKALINIVKQDTTIDEEFKSAVFEEAASGQLALFLTDLLIYSVCVDPTERDKEYPVENYNLPMSNDWFTGRRKELEAIADNFADGCRIQILYGMGGMGKTQIARKYAYDHYRSYSMIHWINARTINSIVECYRGFLEEKQALPNVQTDESICRSYTKYMDSHTDWLIIYDNCDYYTDKEFSDFSNLCLPKNRMVGNILITSRNKRSIGKAKRMRIDTLSDTDAVSFLLQRTESEDTAGAEQLAARLGRFPLGLEIAGAYIHATPGCDFRTYMAYLEQETKILDQMVEVTDYNETIKDILLLTIKRIKEDRNNDKISLCVEDVLHLCSYGAPYNIDLRLFGFLYLCSDYIDYTDNMNVRPFDIHMQAVESVCKDVLERDRLIQTLITYGLATEQPDGLLSMHELQREILKDYIYGEDDWGAVVYNFLFNLVNIGYITWFRYYQHAAYITEHWEHAAKRRSNRASFTALYTMQHCMAQLSLLIEQIQAKLVDNPSSIFELKKATHPIGPAVKNIMKAYFTVEEELPTIDHLKLLIDNLLAVERFYRRIGQHSQATGCIFFALLALHRAFDRLGENEVINDSPSFYGLLHDIRICLPLAMSMGVPCDEDDAKDLRRLRKILNTHAEAMHLNKTQLMEYLLIIDAYVKEDLDMLPEGVVANAMRESALFLLLPDE